MPQEISARQIAGAEFTNGIGSRRTIVRYKHTTPMARSRRASTCQRGREKRSVLSSTGATYRSKKRKILTGICKLRTRMGRPRPFPKTVRWAAIRTSGIPRIADALGMGSGNASGRLRSKRAMACARDPKVAMTVPRETYSASRVARDRRISEVGGVSIGLREPRCGAKLLHRSVTDPDLHQCILMAAGLSDP